MGLAARKLWVFRTSDSLGEVHLTCILSQNKSACAVQLKHIPSGIIVRCQATRSQTQNRKLARQLLADKIEEKEKGSASRVARKQQIKRNKNADRRKKAKRKYGQPKEEAEEEEVDKGAVEKNGNHKERMAQLAEIQSSRS